MPHLKDIRTSLEVGFPENGVPVFRFFLFFFPIYPLFRRNAGKSVTIFYSRIWASLLLSTKRQCSKCYTLPVQVERWRRKPISGAFCLGKKVAYADAGGKGVSRIALPRRSGTPLS